MEKVNYQNKLLDLVSTFNGKPTLLLHSCCGPCSTEVIDFLKDYFLITVFYYNPNVEPEEEYLKRKKEQIRFLEKYNEKYPTRKISFLECNYDNQVYTREVKGLEHEKEGGARCTKCFTLRLRKTAEVAKESNFDFFGTTLTVSPHKNSQVINTIGESISNSLNMPFIYGDFKKNNGYQKSIIFSKEYNLYRQDYCGCLYGKEGR